MGQARDFYDLNAGVFRSPAETALANDFVP
jgi:hypothetical protein